MEGDGGSLVRGRGEKPGKFQNPRDENILRRTEHLNSILQEGRKVFTGLAIQRILAVLLRAAPEDCEMEARVDWGRCYRGNE